MNIADYAIVLAFLSVTFWVGSYFYRWVGTADDFVVAGRKLTPFILAAVLTATNVNLYSFIGQAGIAYKEGIGILWQTWTGNMALVFSGLFVLPVFRRLRIRTIPEFLELRYSKGVRVFVAFIWVFRLAFWLGVISYAASVAAQPITGFSSFTAWLILFSVIAIVYTTLGGMWSVAFTDVMQFVLMLGGALVVLPLAMSAVGWWPGLERQLPLEAMKLVSQTGTYNWQFMLAIFLLGIEWACVDQGLLQRAFAAENTRTVAKGLVLAGIITTPFALLWNIPGLAARVLYPGLANPDMAVPTLLSHLLPNVVLGLVVCGLMSSHLSTISANLNGVATIVASDLYKGFLHPSASDQSVLRVGRVSTAVAGVAMIVFAYLVPLLGTVVEAYLTIIAVMDMPLFVIAVVYGLLWKRTNWQGALAGYAAGAVAGIAGKFAFDLGFAPTTFVSAVVTLLVTPIASMLASAPPERQIDHIWFHRRSSKEEEEQGHGFRIIPSSTGGRLFLGLLATGLVTFAVGTLLGSQGSSFASAVCLSGMILYFAGGLGRAYVD